VAAAFDPKAGWRAGAIMLQRMPDPSIGMDPQDSVLPFRPEIAPEKDDDWNRSTILMQSVTSDELVKPTLHSHELLTRLFHEEGVRIFTPQAVTKTCRCSPDRVRDVLGTLSADDREHASVNGIIEMTCEFCSKTYRFRAGDMTCTEVDEGPQTH
jgi:molecular chaperone Hsp33